MSTGQLSYIHEHEPACHVLSALMWLCVCVCLSMLQHVHCIQNICFIRCQHPPPVATIYYCIFSQLLHLAVPYSTRFMTGYSPTHRHFADNKQYSNTGYHQCARILRNSACHQATVRSRRNRDTNTADSFYS